MHAHYQKNYKKFIKLNLYLKEGNDSDLGRLKKKKEVTEDKLNFSFIYQIRHPLAYYVSHSPRKQG